MKKNYLLVILLLPIFLHGQSFTELCENESTNGTVVAFGQFKDTLYATGFFNKICGEPANYFAKWENDAWTPNHVGISDPGHSLRLIDGFLYVARYEESVDSNWVYVYNGAKMSKLGEGVYLTTATGFSNLPNIYDITKFENSIIACGEFDRSGTQNISGIMSWNGNRWQDMQGGLTGNIKNTAPILFPHQMMVHNGELFVVGNFRYAGGVEVNGIAKWDGGQWTSLGKGFDGTVYSIAVFNNEIYVGGSFTKSGSLPLKRFAKWNGNQWESPGFGFVPVSMNDFAFIHTLVPDNDRLLISGGIRRIQYADGTIEACGGIVEYSSSGVQTFDGGVMGNDIEAIFSTEDNQLIIGGGVFGSGYLGVLDASTSISHHHNLMTVEAFPNPFNDELKIETQARILNVTLTDISGKNIDFEIDKSKTHIQLNHTSSGIYLLTIRTSKGVFRKKLLKD